MFSRDQVFSPAIDKSTRRIFLTLVENATSQCYNNVYEFLLQNKVRRLLDAMYGHPKAGQLAVKSQI